MNKTAELVRLWAEYEATHKDAAIEDFCQSLLMQRKKPQDDGVFLGGVVPVDLHSQIAKVIGRIAKLHISQAQAALKASGINNFEDFIFLNSIFMLKDASKTTVITRNFMELSSGLLIIDRLKQNGLITEKENSQDKRSKILNTTKKGDKVREECYKIMIALNKKYFGHMKTDDLELCINLLASVEVKLSDFWLQSKKKG
ncbi:MarR family transcriptional regulator [Chitinophaga sp. Mgbs1]|uniref:MarR family transcriptional regulator n=1 Tax=Chitinophaga solisilvae TaxID=1233460 RepID=A0A9Q5D5F4_9BACT|nr:MarR family transcriptional regulator [Chitinophaga solisilvae]